jgi:endonuclease/exonuclease/phosphatase family metal-dependent hydrolase
MKQRCYYILRSLKRLFECCCNGPWHNYPKCNSFNCNPDDHVTSIISWNIQGLFYYLYDKKINNVICQLQTFDSDVICLQEVFEDDFKKMIIKKLSDKYPYYLLGNTDKKYCIGEDSGLLVLSKYKISFVSELILPKMICPDRLSKRTILYFQIGDVNLSTTHLQSYNERISEEHIHLILQRSPFKEYILTGDLNHNQADEIIGVRNNNQTRTVIGEILDYILPIQFKYTLTNEVIDMDITDISDHWPIRSYIHRINYSDIPNKDTNVSVFS